jgi:hypothetical protein
MVAEPEVQTETIITEHRPDFHPLRRPANDATGKRKAERRLRIMRQLGLAPPLPGKV